MGGIREEFLLPFRTFPNKGLGSIYFNNTASGDSSFAIGSNCLSEGRYSVAMGINSSTNSSADAAVSAGISCKADGLYSWASGNNCISSGTTSFVVGNNNNSGGDFSAIIGGQNNTIPAAPLGEGIVIIGCNNLSVNGLEPYKVYMQKLEILNLGGGVYVYSPDGNRWLLGVTNAGTLSITAAP